MPLRRISVLIKYIISIDFCTFKITSQTTMRTFLRDVIGISDVDGLDPAVRRSAIQEEGLENLEDLLEFDKVVIKSLCASDRKPGGQIEDPSNAGQRISNPGFHCFVARTYNLVGCGLSQDALNRERLKIFEQHYKLITEHNNPDKMPEIDESFGIIKAMDLLPSHLRDRLGIRKVPLSYAICLDEVPVTLENLDPNIRPLVHHMTPLRRGTYSVSVFGRAVQQGYRKCETRQRLIVQPLHLL